LYEKHFKFVYKKLKENRSLKEESVVDAYTDAVIALRNQVVKGKFRGKSKLSTFLYQIFSNKCIDLIRSTSTHKARTEQNMVYELPVHLAHKEPAVVEKLTVKESFNKLKELISKLGETCQQVLLDWGFWGFSMEEIAQRRGFKDAQTVKSKKYTCMKQLKALISGEGMEQAFGR